VTRLCTPLMPGSDDQHSATWQSGSSRYSVRNSAWRPARCGCRKSSALSATCARRQGVALTSRASADGQGCASRQYGTATVLPMYAGLDLTLADNVLAAKPIHASPHDGTAHSMQKCVGCSTRAACAHRTGQPTQAADALEHIRHWQIVYIPAVLRWLHQLVDVDIQRRQTARRLLKCCSLG
jgi:hypothetical protein